ncbi:MAG: hypothetical protein WC887_03300 [Candidatus Paceibacterota bacterium]|jgi:hypothetical protein
MKDTINTYFALLLITIAGAGAAMVIINVSSEDSFSLTSHTVGLPDQN